MAAWIQWVSNLSFIALLVLFGAIWAGVAAVLSIIKWIRSSWSRTETFTLEYTGIQAILTSMHGGRFSASPRLSLHNPEDVTLRVKVERAFTTFNGQTTDFAALDKPLVLDVGPRTDNAAVQCGGTVIQMTRGQRHVEGRIDWVIRYGKVQPDGTAELTFELPLRGSLDIHFFSHGPESQWCPDRGISAPVMSPQRIRGVVGEEYFLR